MRYPQAFQPHPVPSHFLVNQVSVCLEWTEPMSASDPSPGCGARSEERPYWEAPEGLVQVLKGALLPFGASAYLLTVEARGPQEGLEVLHRTGLPAFCQSEKPVGQTALGWAVTSKKPGSQKW